MRPKARRLPCLVLALAALAGAALAGCGDSDEPSAEDTQAAYESLQTRIENLGGAIGTELQAARNQTDAALERAFERLEQRGDAVAAQLRDLEVPDDLVDERNALRDAIEKGTNDLGDIVTAVRESDPDAARQAAEDLVTDSEAIREARDEFEQALENATR